MNNMLTRKIGSTTYTVNVFFSANATETIEDKILRIIQNHSLANGRKV